MQRGTHCAQEARSRGWRPGLRRIRWRGARWHQVGFVHPGGSSRCEGGCNDRHRQEVGCKDSVRAGDGSGVWRRASRSDEQRARDKPTLPVGYSRRPELGVLRERKEVEPNSQLQATESRLAYLVHCIYPTDRARHAGSHARHGHRVRRVTRVPRALLRSGSRPRSRRRRPSRSRFR